MIDFWYASYVFLGLSLSIGLMIFLILRDKSKKRKKSDLDNLISKEKGEENKTLLEDLEEKYGKKG